MNSIWHTLGVPQDADERTIKRAYARLLKQTRPEDDPEGFQTLREAYDAALSQVRYAVADATAATPEMEQSTASQQPDEAAAPGNADALETAWQEAAAMWESFLAAPEPNSGAKLEAMSGSHTPLSLLARDALEVIAVRYCAMEACPPALRAVIVEHFGWDQDSAHVSRLDGEAAYFAVARYRADAGYEQLRSAASGSVAVRKLLTTRPPKFSLQLLDSRFVVDMRRHVNGIRWQMPEVLHFHLNTEVFEWWEQRVSVRRYTTQTLLYSILFGCLSFLALLALFSSYSDEEAPFLPLFLGAMGASITGAFWLTVRPPKLLFEIRRRWWDEKLLPLLHEPRYHQLVRLGWVLPFALLSLLLFVPEPGGVLRHLTSLAMLACAAAALFGASPNLVGKGYALIAFIAATAGTALHLSGFISNQWLAMFCAFVCIQTLAFNYAERDDDLRALSRMRLALRIVWLIGGALLVYSFGQPKYGLGIAMGTWLWIILGVVLARFALSIMLVWPALIGVRMLANMFRDSTNLPDPHLAGLQPLLLVVAIFMIATIFQSAKQEPQYS